MQGRGFAAGPLHDPGRRKSILPNRQCLSLDLAYCDLQLWAQDDYAERLTRLPDPPQVYAAEREGDLVAGLAVRDWSPLLQPSILAVHPVMRLANWVTGMQLEPGKPLRTLLIDDVWGDDPRTTADLVKWAVAEWADRVELAVVFGDPRSGVDCDRRHLKGFGGRLFPVLSGEMAIGEDPVYLPVF